jgi:hypothetical protein
MCVGGIQALGQLAAEQQPQLQLTVAVVGLRSPLAAAPDGRLGRIGEMRRVAGTLDLLDHEPPTSRALEREVHILTSETLQPGTHRLTRGRADPAAPGFATGQLDRPIGDLPAVHIQRTYDPHRDLLELHGLERPACSNTLLPRRPHHMSSMTCQAMGGSWFCSSR